MTTLSTTFPLALRPTPGAVHEPDGNVDQDLGEHVVLARDVPVQAGAGDPHDLADVFEPGHMESTVGDHRGGGGDDFRVPPLPEFGST